MTIHPATHLKVHARAYGRHVYVRFHAGAPQWGEFQFVGMLSFRLEEWRAMRELLLAGRSDRVELIEEGEAARA